ncbi:unnamed protein product [Pleuronectes platessa]|uniref:Uncharacterized protein n=1 Tax=Pleuronectes platessa TaxID=8262 RepID=A0A9N7YBD4_PLEPL|nr:unnamed protein product [Pleuronectes platessa]
MSGSGHTTLMRCPDGRMRDKQGEEGWKMWSDRVYRWDPRISVYVDVALPIQESTQSCCHQLIPCAFITSRCCSMLAATVTSGSLQPHWARKTMCMALALDRNCQRISDNLDKGCEQAWS